MNPIHTYIRIKLENPMPAKKLPDHKFLFYIYAEQFRPSRKRYILVIKMIYTKAGLYDIFQNGAWSLREP